MCRGTNARHRGLSRAHGEASGARQAARRLCATRAEPRRSHSGSLMEALLPFGAIAQVSDAQERQRVHVVLLGPAGTGEAGEFGEQVLHQGITS